jgi:hypothetical protein
MVLRGLVFHTHSLADMGDVAGLEAELAEADVLAAGDPLWELTATHADVAHLRGDDLRGLELYADSLSWSCTTGESHQMLMDLRGLAPSLVGVANPEEAIEIDEIVRLEEQRTGRIGDMPTAFGWLTEAISAAEAQVDAAAAQRARARARAVPETQRAEHAIEVARRVVAEVRAG